jgi:hypothetical protein
MYWCRRDESITHLLITKAYPTYNSTVFAGIKGGHDPNEMPRMFSGVIFGYTR